MFPDEWWRALLIPGFQALVTGGFVFIAGLACCYLLHAPWHYAAIAAGLVSLLAWWGFWGWWSQIIREVLLPERLRLSEPDEPAEPQVVRVVIESDRGASTQFIDLPASPEQLAQLAEGILSGAPFTFNAWAGVDKPFKQPEFGALQAELLKRKLIVARNPRAPNQGYAFTVAGMQVLKKFRSPTLSTQDDV